MSLRLSTPMKTLLTAALGRAMRTPDGTTVYQVDTYRAHRTVTALQRRGLVVMEARTVLDGNGKAHQATTSWLTAEGVTVAQRLTGTPQEAAHNAMFLDADGQFRHADRSHGAYMSAQNNADQTAREEGFGRYTERWYAVVNSSYASLLDDGAFTEPGQEEAPEAPRTAEAVTAFCDLHSCGGDCDCCAKTEVFVTVGDTGHQHYACRTCIRVTGVKPVDHWTGEVLALPEEAAQEPQERPQEAPAAQETQERPEDARAAVVARLDAIWSKGYVTGPGLTLEQHRIAAEVIADHHTDGDTRKVFGRDRAALVAEYRNKSTYDVMNAYGAVRLATGGDVWALVGKNRGGERPESLRPLVEEAVTRAGEVAVWSSTSVTAAEVEHKGADVIAPEAVTVYLAQELSAGHTVHRHARGALRVTRENGAVIMLRPAGALAA